MFLILHVYCIKCICQNKPKKSDKVGWGCSVPVPALVYYMYKKVVVSKVLTTFRRGGDAVG